MPGQPTDETKLPPRRRGARVGVDGPTNLGLGPHQGHKPGDIIGTHYKVVRQIGAGGMGVVYEVINTITGVPSAVKRLSPELSISAEHREAFIREATDTILFTGKSEYFVTTQTVDIDALGPFLVLEYVEHPTLRAIIENHPDGMPTDAAIAVLHGLAYSLSELHRLGFVHRDLKPENVFVGPPADEPLVMLADFGLSKSHTERTRTSIRRAGTDRYISPEQRNGLETNITTDIYAFGIMAIELLTGDVLSPGDSLEDEKPDLPADFCTLVNRCTKRRQEQRPSTSDELFEVLDTIRNQLMVPKFRPGVIHFVTKQPGVVIDCAGQQSSAESPLVIPFETSDERRIMVDAKWKHVSLLISFINLSPGDEHTIELPAGFVFDAELPTGCTLFYKNGSAVSLPISGQMPQQGYYYFEVFHDGASVLSQKVTIHPGENYWRPSVVLPAKPEALQTTLRLLNLLPDSVVIISGEIVKSPFVFSREIARGETIQVQVDSRWRGVGLFVSAVTLKAGDDKSIEIPSGYQLNVELPLGVTPKGVAGNTLTFPIKADLPASRSLQVELYYRNQSLGKHTVMLSAGVNTWTPTVTLPSEPQKLMSKLTLYGVMAGAEVWINGIANSGSFVEMIEIPTGATKAVSIKCVWHGLTLYDSKVTIAAGETKTVNIPKGFELYVEGLKEDLVIESVNGRNASTPIRGIVDDTRAVVVRLRRKDGICFNETIPIHAGSCKWIARYQTASIVLDGVQDGAMATFDTRAGGSPYKYQIDLLEGTSQSCTVTCSWRGISLLDTTVTLMAGLTSTLKVAKAYELLATIPMGCVARLKSGTVQTFPMKGLLPKSGSFTFEVLAGGKVIDTCQVSINAGLNSWKPTTRLPVDVVAPELAKYVASACAIPALTFPLSEFYTADLLPFQIGNTTVTVHMWQEYCAANQLKMPPAPDYGWFSGYPMTNVTWEDCQRYATWASKVCGLPIRLPTEAQWQCAASTGESGFLYPWGNTWDPSLTVHSTNRPALVNRSNNVYVSLYGVSDMASNVCEWCTDWMTAYPDGVPRTGVLNEWFALKDPTVIKNPGGPTNGEHKVIRGGSYRETEERYFTCNYRRRALPDKRFVDVGFRLAIYKP